MIHSLRKRLLYQIQDTPFENVFRQIYGRVFQPRGAAYDRQTVKVMKKVLKVDSNCVDVGAYRGDILRIMLAMSSEGTVFAFEPIPENYEYLSKGFPKANIFQMALSDQSKETVFYHVLGRPARSGLRPQDYPDPREKAVEIKIQTDKLDNVIPEKTKIDFIKIDVEGAEFRVLSGSERILKRDRPIVVFEHSAIAASKYETGPDQIYDFLTARCGLSVSLMEKWLKHEPPLSKPEFLTIVERGLEFYFIAY